MADNGAETHERLRVRVGARTRSTLRSYQCSPRGIRPERRPGIAPGSRGWRPRVLLL